METMKLQKRVTASAMLDPKIVVPAIWAAFAKLDPRLMVKNPVMFVVETVAALTYGDLRARSRHRRRQPWLHRPDHYLAVVHGAVRQFRRSRRRRPRQGAGRVAEEDPHREQGQAAERRGQELISWYPEPA